MYCIIVFCLIYKVLKNPLNITVYIGHLGWPPWIFSPLLEDPLQSLDATVEVKNSRFFCFSTFFALNTVQTCPNFNFKSPQRA